MQAALCKRQHAVYLAALALILIVGVVLNQANHAPTAAAAERPLAYSLNQQRLPLAQAAATVSPDGLAANNAVSLNCRYGAAASGSSRYWLDVVGAGWHLNFTVSGNFFNGSDFVYVVRTRQNKDANGNYEPGYTLEPDADTLRAAVNSSPGSLWIVGNEIERIGQDEIFPDTYAEAYHEVYHLIKEEDPSARVAISGLVQVTPNRMRYLDMVWDAYSQKYNRAMPVDVWNAHIYTLPEVFPDGQPNDIASTALGVTDLSDVYYESDNNPALCNNPDNNTFCWADHDNMDIFTDQVVRMRQWMKDHGQQDKPLIISEYGILYPNEWPDGIGCFEDEFGNCFTPERVNDYINATFDYFETTTSTTLGYPADSYRLVQQWLWFSMWSAGVGDASNLLDDDFLLYENGDPAALTTMGAEYQAGVAAGGELTFNLLVDKALGASAFRDEVTGEATVNLTARIRNNGTERILEPVTITFYKNAALTQVIGSTTLAPVILGCTAAEYEASVAWTLSTPGVHKYWVKVDSDNMVVETSESDNLKQGTVLIDPDRTFLPIVPSRH